jgi:ATP-dependent exoDNAse (exonuclease V) beta subunit
VTVESSAMRAGVADERHLIGEALAETLVVEAAAGTGKTTELVNRVVRLIETETAQSIEEIVAVTFSEKAAGELKLRLREELERHLIASEPGSAKARALARAVQQFEEAHVSTIHGFCADLLRERPVEARIDPAFEVLTEGPAIRLFDEVFGDWMQEQLESPAPGVRRALRRVRPRFGPHDEDAGPIDRIRSAGWELLQWRDHPRAWTRPPGFAREPDMEALLDALATFVRISSHPIDRGDLLFRETERMRQAHAEIDRLRSRGLPDFEGWEARLCELAAHERDLRKGRSTRGQYSREMSRQAVCEARDMVVDALVRFRVDADADLAALLHAELRSCILSYEQRKARAGVLDFLDLLIRARDLVRDVPEVRHEFQRRFRFILVDEFQDTDPLQADLLWMLAADEPPGFVGDPLELPVRCGGLFVVGDPKQSIYRFRRADVGVYHRVRRRLLDGGARPVELKTSFRSVPHIQRAVNAAFNAEMIRDAESLQADYIPLLPSRLQPPGQPSVVVLPVPRPYGRMEVTQTAIGRSLPEAIGEFVRWVIADSGWRIPDGHGGERSIEAGDVCLLFRRFVDYTTDITRGYVQALESRGVPHLLVGGKAFHEREEIDALRTALAAIERPDDALSVFATLRGPFFAIPEEDMLAWQALGHRFRPFDVPEKVAPELEPLADALRILRDLTRRRNHRPVAETIGQLLDLTRAHAAFIFWRSGEQVLANVLQIQELARQYEAEGGLSFRGFVDELRSAADRAQTPEAPILEEGTDGVRLMTVHKAKGLEFPVVILADIGCKLHRPYAQRHLDAERGLAAVTLSGWTPLDLSEHNDLETSRDRAEAVRLAYVAATRARDVLVVPAIGDAPYATGWVSPLSPAIYPAAGDSTIDGLERVPAFAGRDTVLERPLGQNPGFSTVRPGGYVMSDPCTGETYQVVWWDPALLDRSGEERRGIRREDLITKDADPATVADDRARYEEWKRHRSEIQARAARPSLRVVTATDYVRTPPPGQGQLFEMADPTDGVAVLDAGFGGFRPGGRRFGVLVHALLAAVPLDASQDTIVELANVHARMLGADDDERNAAAAVVEQALTHEVLAAARAAAASGRACRREAPIAIVRDEVLIDGQVDLAFETDDGWMVVDFKTDAELGRAEADYRRQVVLYADALAAITGKPAAATILRV